MRVLPFLSAPLVMAATVFGAGWWLRSADLLHARLQYDAMGGPAAWVLYGTVVGLGMVHLLFDRVVEVVRLAARRTRRASRPRPVVAGPVPVPLPPVPPATTATTTPRVFPAPVHPPVRVVRAVRRPRAPRVVAPAVVTPLHR